MSLPEVELTKYIEEEDRSLLNRWWEDPVVPEYVSLLSSQLDEEPIVGSVREGWWKEPCRIAAPRRRWMVRELRTGAKVGFISMDTYCDIESDTPAPPFRGGVNIVKDLDCGIRDIGTAALVALYRREEIAELSEISGTVKDENSSSLRMVEKFVEALGLPLQVHTERPGVRYFVVPGPGARP